MEQYGYMGEVVQVGAGGNGSDEGYSSERHGVLDTNGPPAANGG